MNLKKFNIWTKTQIAPPSEYDCTDDYYEVDDAELDHQYLNEKIVQAIIGVSENPTVEMQIIYGGVVSDAGSGKINISAGLGIGKDKDSGCVILFNIPALSAVSLPSGWNDNREIFLTGKYTVKTTGVTRAHYEGSAYYYQVADSYFGESSSDDLFLDVNPGVTTQLVWDSFKMSGTTFTSVGTKSASFIVGKNYVNYTKQLGAIDGGLSMLADGSALYVNPGYYEIYDGTIKRILANTSPDLTLMKGDQSLRSEYWYNVIMNKSGAITLQPVTEAYIGKTYSITSISGTNTLNFSSSVGGTQPLAGMVVVIEGATTATNNGFWIINSVAGSPVTSITVFGTLTNQADAAGTVKVYYRISTYHFGGGSEVGVTTAGNAIKYSPSHNDSLFETPVVRDWTEFNIQKNGYYSKWTDFLEYRILGCVYYTTSYGYTNLISYKSGRNKNDNFAQVQNANWNTLVGTLYRFTITDFEYMYGNDYILSDDGTNAGGVEFLREGLLNYGFDVSMSAKTNTTYVTSIVVNMTNNARSSSIVVAITSLQNMIAAATLELSHSSHLGGSMKITMRYKRLRISTTYAVTAPVIKYGSITLTL